MPSVRLLLAAVFSIYGLVGATASSIDPIGVTLEQYHYKSLYSTSGSQDVDALLANVEDSYESDHLQGTRVCALSDNRVLVFARLKNKEDSKVRGGYMELVTGDAGEWTSARGLFPLDDEGAWWEMDWDEVTALHCDPKTRTAYFILSIGCWNHFHSEVASGLNPIDTSGLCFNTGEYVAAYKLTLPEIPGSGEHTLVGGVLGATKDNVVAPNHRDDWKTTAPFIGPGPRPDTLYVAGSTRRNLVEPYLYGPNNTSADQWQSTELYVSVISASNMSMLEYYRVPTPNDTVGVYDQHVFIYAGASLGADGLWAGGRRMILKGGTTKYYTSYVARLDAQGNLLYHDGLGLNFDDITVSIAPTTITYNNTIKSVIVVSSLQSIRRSTFDARIVVYEASDAAGGALGAELRRISFSTPKVDYFMSTIIDEQTGVVYAPIGAGSSPLLASFALPDLAPLAEYSFPCTGDDCMLLAVSAGDSYIFSTGHTGQGLGAARMVSPVNLALVQVPKTRSNLRNDRLYTQHADGMLSFSLPTDQASMTMAPHPCSHNGSVIYGYTRHPVSTSSPSTVVIDYFPEKAGLVPISISSNVSLFVKAVEAHDGFIFVGVDRSTSYPSVYVYDLATHALITTYHVHWRETGKICKLIFSKGFLFAIVNFTFDKDQGSSFELLKLEWKDSALTLVAEHVLSTDYHTGTLARDGAIAEDGVLFICGESMRAGVRPVPQYAWDSVQGDLEAFVFSFDTATMLPQHLILFASPSYDACVSIDTNRDGTTIYIGGVTRASLDGSGGLSSVDGWVKAVSWPSAEVVWTQQTQDERISTSNDDMVTAVVYDEGAGAVLVGGQRLYDEDYVAMFSAGTGKFEWLRIARSELDIKCTGITVRAIFVMDDAYYSVGTSCVSLHPTMRSAPYSGSHIESAKFTQTARPGPGRRLLEELGYPLEDGPCDAGFYQPDRGRSSCIPCPANMWAAEGQSQCYTCDTPGTRPNYDQSGCMPCEIGHYSSRGGAAQCTPAPPGQYQDSTGATKALACPAGFYNTEDGQSSCKPCEPGTYSSRTGTIQCAVCSAGQYSDEYGAIKCKVCAMHTYSGRTGLSKCDVCPNGSTTEDEGAQTARECQCPQGQYGQPFRGVPCSDCPPRTRCPRNSEFPKPNGGVFVESSKQSFSYVCSPANACPGDSLDSCADGYSGEACSECAPNYYRTQGECIQCLVDPLPKWMRAILTVCLYLGGLILVVAMLACYGTYVAIMEGIQRLVTLCVAGLDIKMVLGMAYRFALPVVRAVLRAAKGFIRYMQLSTLVLGVSVPWPGVFKAFSSFFSVANIDLSFAFQIPCLQDTSEYSYADQYVSRVVLYLITAVVVAVGILVVEGLAQFGRIYVVPARKARMAIHDILKEHSKREITKIDSEPAKCDAENMTRAERRVMSLVGLRNRIRANAIMLADVFYLVFHATATEPFQCYEKTNGVYHMTMDPTVQCYAEGVWADTILPLGIITFIVFSLGIPLAEIAIVTATWLTKSRESTDMEASFAYLWDPYREGMKGWQVISILYRALIGCAVFISFSGEGDQFLILFVLFCGYTLITVRYYPFEDEWENRVESSVGVVLVSTSVIGMLLLNTEGVSSGAATVSSVVCVAMHVTTWALIIILSVRQCEFPTSRVKAAAASVQRRASSSSLLQRRPSSTVDVNDTTDEPGVQRMEEDEESLANSMMMETNFSLLSTAGRAHMADFDATDSNRPGIYQDPDTNG